MSCYCRNDTPCQPCLDTAHTEQNSADLRAEQASFLDATADFYIAGWTPEDEDSREHDRKILDDMTAEAHDNPDMAHALRTLYGDDTFTADDLAAMMKHDAKDWDAGERECACNGCAEDTKWYNQ